MKIYKILNFHLPSPDRPEEEAPQLVSPFIDRSGNCLCGVIFQAICYVVPGITRAQHFHPESGGIYCYPSPDPCLMGPSPIAVGESLGNVIPDQHCLRVAAVRLDALHVYCDHCFVLITSGHLITRQHLSARWPVCTVMCDSCAPAVPLAWLTGWTLRVRDGLPSWSRAKADALRELTLPPSREREITIR